MDKDQRRDSTTYKSPVDQAFSYTQRLDKCKWIIVSNFVEIRLYQVGRSKEYFETFYLRNLDDIDEFRRFCYILSKENLISKYGTSNTYKLTQATQKRDENISKKFYSLYSKTRVDLFEHILENNDDIEPEIALEKSQKFLDRIIFICFCEDKNLLPNDLLHNAIEQGKNSFLSNRKQVWPQIKGVFNAIDKGNPKKNINAFNGGLFEDDIILDNLVIKDGFFEVIYRISDYDFDSDIDVNILGHIFEQSISDIEKLKSDIQGIEEYDKSESKRKQQGIYYTPRYITRYIVEQAIGRYLEDIKIELGYYELDSIEDAEKKSKKIDISKDHLAFYKRYEDRLIDIKILDPACGSGAFLNQAFDYLLNEHKWINTQRDLIEGVKSIFAVDSAQRNILKNNLFGVDLNEESVEITKLSLWLKTANKRKPLTNLDDNIKCGNSLVDDFVIAGAKAFVWEDEFKDIIVNGGFDVIVGNPPYIKEYTNRDAFNGLREKKYYQGKMDIWTFFACKGIDLLKTEGRLSFIAPSNWITNSGSSIFRNKVLTDCIIENYIDFGDYKVFEDAGIQTMIFVLKRSNSTDKYTLNYLRVDNKNISHDEVANIILSNQSKDNKSLIFTSYKAAIVPSKLYNKTISFIDEVSENLVRKIKNKGNYYLSKNDAAQGIVAPQDFVSNSHLSELSEDIKVNDGVFVLNNKELSDLNLTKNEMSYIKPFYTTDELERYYGNKDNKYWIIYTKSDIDEYVNNLINIKNHLDQFSSIITSSNAPYGLHRARDENFFRGEKIISLRKAVKPHFTYTDFDCYVSQTFYVIKSDKVNLKYLTAILNSKVIEYWLKKKGKMQGDNFQVDKGPLMRIPIYICSEGLQNVIKNKVNKIISLKKDSFKIENPDFIELSNTYTSHNKITLEQILPSSNFVNKIYTGRASILRTITVDVNSKIITIYTSKSGSGMYEILKFEEEDEYKRKYIKYYMENLSEEILEDLNELDGNIFDKTLQIGIPDYDKDHVVRKVVIEWEKLQSEITKLEEDVTRIDKEIDQLVYELYGLTKDEIEVIDDSI